MATLRARPSFENWDDDFDIDDDFAARQLSYGSTAASNTFVRKPSSRSGLSTKVNLAQFAENDEDNFDDELPTIDATAKASRLRKQASMQLVFNAQKHGIELPEHIKQANTLKQDTPTLRNKVSNMQMTTADNSLISGSLYEPPADNKLSSVEESLEDGFDFESSAPLKLTLQNLKKASSESDFDDESLGFRAASRLSQLSSLSTVTTATSNSNVTYSEPETDLEDLDTGFDDLPPSNLDFRQRLEKTRQKAAEDAQRETELWRLKQEANQPFYKGNSSGVEYPVDSAADLLEGLELDDVNIDNLTTRGTMHRNAMINGRKISNMKEKKSSIDLGRSMLRKAPSGANATPRSESKSHQFTAETIRVQNTPSRRESSTRLKSLRAVQSMANLGSSRRSSALRQGSTAKGTTGNGNYYPAQTISSRHIRRRIFGDGSELDLLNDLPEVPSTEQTLRGVPSQLLEQYKEKPVKSTLRHHTKASQLKDRSSQVRNRHRAPQKSKYSTIKPALIQQLGAPIQTGTANDMKFNAQKQIWEGNDMELKKFDSINKTPGLIAYISHNGMQQTSGDMMFDAQNLRWVSNKINTEEESDPFAGLDDLEDDFSTCQSEMQLKGSLSASNINQIAVGNEFDLSKEFVAKLQHEDERWLRKYQAWFPAGETFNRDYLGEIRDMIVNQ